MSQHISSQQHKRAMEAQRGTLAISTNITKGQTEAENVLTVELKMAVQITKKNIPFSFCDNFSASVAGMFPDSTIARKYSSGRTKTTQLFKGNFIWLMLQLDPFHTDCVVA